MCGCMDKLTLFLVKFNHAIELGAFRAYNGHYARTGDDRIKSIAHDELEHRIILDHIIYQSGSKPSRFLNWLIGGIGNIVGRFCKYAPLWSLDFVAKTLEIFAVYSYTKLADRCEKYRPEFLEMAETEKKHEEYFK